VTVTADGTSKAGRTPRGERTRARLLEAAEQVFAEFGYHDASIVKLTEAAGVAQGTFYLYFASKLAVFDELVDDLNRRVRHAMSEGSAAGTDRIESEGLQEASAAGQIAQDIDPVVAAWALMGVGELVGMRWVLWDDAAAMPPPVFDEVMRFVQRALGARDVPGAER